MLPKGAPVQLDLHTLQVSSLESEMEHIRVKASIPKDVLHELLTTRTLRAAWPLLLTA